MMSSSLFTTSLHGYKDRTQKSCHEPHVRSNQRSTASDTSSSNLFIYILSLVANNIVHSNRKFHAVLTNLAVVSRDQTKVQIRISYFEVVTLEGNLYRNSNCIFPASERNVSNYS